MKVYVASAFGNKAQVRHVFTLLAQDGHEVTHDWTRDVNVRDEVVRRSMGRACLRAVVQSDAVLMLPTAESTGSWLEVGYAHAFSIPTVIVSPVATNVVFEAQRGIERVCTMRQARSVLKLWESAL